MAETKICSKCGKPRDIEMKFYKLKDGSPMDMCKECMTMHIDNFDESTYLWILKAADVPYVPGEWFSIRNAAYAKNPDKVNGMSVLGKYLSKMKLKQWKKYTWADTDALNAELGQKREENAEAKEAYEADLKQRYENNEISEAEYKTLMSAETQYKDYVAAPPAQVTSPIGFYDETQYIKEEELKDYTAELTQDDKIYLAMKWGRLYKPAEWVELEKNYNEMMNSFDIQDADTISTLILLCKTNLKMNQALDCGDVESFQKLSKVSESLRKTAKFTAAQNKEQKNDYVDSVGELVAICEKQGYIPRFAIDIPQDKVDFTLKDMENYLNKLVTQDLGFGQQIEDALKKIQLQKEANEEFDQAELFDAEVEELSDEELNEYYTEIEYQKELDNTEV